MLPDRRHIARPEKMGMDINNEDNMNTDKNEINKQHNSVIVYQLPDPPLRGVVSITVIGRDDDGRAWVATEPVYAHPRGGGQQEDRGRVAGLTLLHVAHDDTHGVRHYVASVDSLREGAHVEIEIDAEWRHLQARSHSGGHALAAAAAKILPGLRPVAAHHWLGQARVEFEGYVVDANRDGAHLLELVREFARRSEPVAVGMDAVGRRTITIAGMSTNCGGTHLIDCSPLTCMEIRGIKAKGGRIRVSYGFVGESAT